MNPSFIKSMSDQELIKSTERVVEQERKIIQVVIWHLQEIQDRKLFILMGYPSLYECLIEHFKMSDTTAYGRIKVLKILEDVPEVSESLKLGELNISNIALAHSFIERHEKVTGDSLSQEDKAELFENLKNKTTAETKEFFARCNPETALPYDEIKLLTASHSQIRSTVSNELVEKINYLKSLISHENINPTHEELLSLAFDALIEKTEKKKGFHQTKAKTQNIEELNSESSLAQRKISDAEAWDLSTKPVMTAKMPLGLTDRSSRYVSRKVKRFILRRAENQCEHIQPDGTRCPSRFQLQFDHVIAFSKGGSARSENMQLLCRVHNAVKSDW